MFLDLRIVDVLDIVLLAFLLFQLYKMIRGTVALNIFIGLFSFLVVWLLVRAFNMELMSAVFDNLISVGIIAIMILFQEVIRKFFIMVGSRYDFSRWFKPENVLQKNKAGMLNIYIKPIVQACKSMSEQNIGALILITKSNDLLDIIKTGELINGVISAPLLENIFFKNSPLHDGAVIISQNKIKAARCILPLSHNTNLPKTLGLRHRAGLGIAQSSDVQVIIVSEETGKISFAHMGKLVLDVTPEQLTDLLKNA